MNQPSKPIREAIADAEAEKVDAEAGGFVPLSAELEHAAPPPLVPAPPEPERGADLRDENVAASVGEGDPGEIPTGQDPAPDDEPDGRELAGKRVVLVYDVQYATGWKLLVNPDSQQGFAEPLLYEGNRDEAPKAALDDERNATLADLVRTDPERFLLVSVPASSWAPATMKPRITKTTWTVVR